jgi:hypothetical protein
MVMGFWGRHSRVSHRVKAPRPGSKEASVARRDRTRSITLEVRITFEPSRVSPACVAQAYERVVPITRRPAPRAGLPHQAEGAQQRQHVGGRQQV